MALVCRAVNGNHVPPPHRKRYARRCAGYRRRSTEPDSRSHRRPIRKGTRLRQLQLDEMENTKTWNKRRRPEEDASEFGVVRIISRPAPMRRAGCAASSPYCSNTQPRRGRPRPRRIPFQGRNSLATTSRRKPDAARIVPHLRQPGPECPTRICATLGEGGAFGEKNAPYEAVFGDVSKIIDAARESAVRSVNAAMTAAYWLIGRRIVEFEQSGEERAEYGAALIERLAEDLTGRFDRGFSRQNVQNMRLFYLSYPIEKIRQTLPGKLPAFPR